MSTGGKLEHQFQQAPRAKHLEDEFTHRDLFGTVRGRCLQCNCTQYVKETANYTIQPGEQGRKHPHNDPDITNCSRCGCATDCHEVDMASNEKEHGNDSFQLGRYNEAIIRYTRGLDYRPSDETLWSNRSAAYLAKGSYNEALHDAKRAVEIKPDWAKARARKAMAHLCLNEYEQSVAEYKVCVKLDPGKEEYRDALKSAREKYEKQWDPRRRANEAMNSGRFDRAISLYTEILAKDPKDYRVLSNRSAAFAKAKRYREALSDANRLVEVAPRWPKAWSRKGLALYYMKQYDKAIVCYEQGLKFDPGNKNIQEALRDAKVQLENHDNNFSSYEKERVNPENKIEHSHPKSTSTCAKENSDGISVHSRLNAIEEKLDHLCQQSNNIASIVKYLQKFEPYILALDKQSKCNEDCVEESNVPLVSSTIEAETDAKKESVMKTRASSVEVEVDNNLYTVDSEDLSDGIQEDGPESEPSNSEEDAIIDNPSDPENQLESDIEGDLCNELDKVLEVDRATTEDILCDKETTTAKDKDLSTSISIDSVVRAEDIFNILKIDNQTHAGFKSNDSNDSSEDLQDVEMDLYKSSSEERPAEEEGEEDKLSEADLASSESDLAMEANMEANVENERGNSVREIREVPITIRAEDIFSICNNGVTKQGSFANPGISRKEDIEFDSKNAEVDPEYSKLNGNSVSNFENDQERTIGIARENSNSSSIHFGDNGLSSDQATAAACKIFDNVWSTLEDEDEDVDEDNKDEDYNALDDERWFELEAEWAEVKTFCEANRDFIKPPFREKRKFYETVKPPPGEENASSKLNIANLTKRINESTKIRPEKDWFGIGRCKCKSCPPSVCHSFRPSFQGSAAPSCVYERALQENDRRLLDFALQWNSYPAGKYCLNCGCEAENHETEEESQKREKMEQALLKKKEQVDKSKADLKRKKEFECRQRVIKAAQRKKSAEENGEFIRETSLDFITQMRRGPCLKCDQCPGFKVYFRESDAHNAEVMLYCSLCGYPSQDHPIDSQWVKEQQRKKNEEKQQWKPQQRKGAPSWKVSKYNEAQKSACRLLGIHENATSVQINKAYKRLALKYHPDKNPSPKAHEFFVRVTQAFQLLQN